MIHRAFVGSILALLLVTAAAVAEPKRVLLLHSFGPYFAPWNAVAGRFREELIKQSPYPIDLYEASLESARFLEPSEEGPIVDYLLALFSKRNLDLIVTMGAPAAKFAQKHRDSLFASTALLIAAADVRTVNQTALTANDAAVTTTLDLAKLVENVLHVLPDTKSIAFIIGASPLERYWVEELRRATEPFRGRVNFQWFNDASLDEILHRAASLPQKSALFYGGLRVDARGVPHEEDHVLTRLHAVANAPIFGYVDTNFGNGIVGGPHLSIVRIAQRTASVAIRILNGEVPSDIWTQPIALEAPAYDFRELRRWSIREAQLPPGSSIHFREPAIWERYRIAMISALALLLVQAGMITWLLLERRDRFRAQLESHRRSQEVFHLNRTAEAGALAGSFAHELGQPLAAISLNIDAAGHLLGAHEPDTQKLRVILSDIQRADQQAIDIVEHFRRLVKRGRDSPLEVVDLNDVIADALYFIRPEARRRRIQLLLNNVQHRLPVRADRIHLQQVVINLANNAMDAIDLTNSGLRRIAVEARALNDGLVEVAVSDCGSGIPECMLADIFKTFYTTKENGTGLGLSIARTIVETYGGRIWAENRPEGGAVLRFTLPLTRSTKIGAEPDVPAVSPNLG